MIRIHVPRSVAVLAVFLSAVLVPPALTQDAPPLTAGADVVILTGLPGDVENETTYQGQIERLLEILALAEPGPRRVFVLNDTAETGPIPAGLDVEVKAGHRRHVLELADELGGAPLVVFAWGHGGTIGQDSVFHVRGPRLGPDDFRALAAKADTSRFLLFFRQSGAFARALRAPGREIVSSEHTKVFKSAPMGVDLLLETLRAAPDLPFVDLAEKLGPAILAWYDEQHLARQEEPTLWPGEDEPRLLAQAEPRAAEPVATAAASIWEDVEPVRASLYPSASAVVLKRDLRYVLGDNPALVSEVDEFIQVLTPEGMVHGDFDIAYYPPAEKMTFLDCEVRRANGTILRLDASAFRDATSQALPGYRAATRKIFSLPQSTPGSILRVHYRREYRRFPLPHITLDIPISSELPVRESRVEVKVARDAPFHWTFSRHPKTPPEIGETPYGHTYSWSFRDLEPVPAEVLSAPRQTPMLLVSTFPSWEQFSGWYRRLIRQADELTPEIAAKADELTRGLDEPRAKVAALYDWVTGLRYVAIPFGVNSHRPHAAANVFENRYGDCKDKANLFNTMLRSVGIEADLVLVPRFSQAYDETPGLGFNHAISRVRLDGEVIWADTTDDIARFGLLPPGDPGRNVLVIHEDESRLTPLPSPAPADHVLRSRARIELASRSEEGGAVLEMTTAGFPDYELRSLVRALGGTIGTRPVALTRLRLTNGYFAMRDQSHTRVAALDESFAWRGEGSFTGLAAPFGDGVLVRAPFLLPENWTLALHERTTPLYVHQGYPLTLDQEVTFVLPPLDPPEVTLPPTATSQDGPLRWRLTWKQDAPKEIVVARLEVVLASGELDWEETVLFQRELRRLFEALAQGTVYRPRS